MSRAGLTGHAAALLTIFLWGTTFISTKVLLTGLRPVEVLFLRFALGFAALCLLYPRRLRLAGRRQELWFAAAGLCGVTLYFLLENIALTCTLAARPALPLPPAAGAAAPPLFRGAGRGPGWGGDGVV